MNFQANLDGQQWNLALAELPASCRDVYFTPDYHQLHVANGDGRAFCSAVRDAAAVLLIPGLKTAVPPLGPATDETWDLQTCNGYGGPLAAPDASREFLEAAWAGWREDCRERRIVAAFFRLHPLLGNECFLPRDATIVRDRQTVFLDLSAGLDRLWAQAESRYRNMVSKGRREGLRVDWNEPGAWAELESFYNRAMQRLDAPAALRFTPAYFDALRRLPGAELASIRSAGALVAVSAFLFGPVWCHYHLSARDPEAGNHLHSVILQSAIERAAERGAGGLHLGGGRSTSPDDGLFRFKKSTGGQLRDFRVALVVADRSRYETLCRAWQESEGRPPSWLLGYRQPTPAIVEN